MRTDFFKKYYTVPEGLKPEIDSFIDDINKLGEKSADAQYFEAKFAANGYQERFNSLLMRCTPKAYSMTEEEKNASKETAKQIFEEDRERIIKEAVEDAIDYADVMTKEELIAQRRKIMIEADVYDDYTRVSNAVDIAGRAGNFVKGLFKKKK